jgi:ABC-type uncharacterized transport system substrate-binding protein
MRRRELVALLSVSAASPLATVAQQRKPTIGFLGAGTPSTWSHRVASFAQRLGELGWFESRNVAIEYRWADGNARRYSEIAAEFVRLNVDVIVTGGTPSRVEHLGIDRAAVLVLELHVLIKDVPHRVGR